MDKDINIKKLLEENNIRVPVKTREVYEDTEQILGPQPDLSRVENSTEGIEINTEELLKNRPKKEEGIVKSTIGPEQEANILEYLNELEEEANLAKKEFEEHKRKTRVMDLFDIENDEILKRKNQYVQPKEKDSDEIEIEEEIEPSEQKQERNIQEPIKNIKESLSDENDKIEVINDRDSEDENIVDDMDNLKKQYDEAVILIDKTNMGKVDFTPEEKAKMEHVKTIKVKEIETVSLNTIKRKKVKKGSADKILKKLNSIKTTSVVLPMSGLVVKVCGCSTFELMGLVEQGNDTKESTIARWSLIHSKVVDTSIGKLSFDDFLKSVASFDYDTLVYGILCATFPEEDIFPLNCPKCNQEIKHKYVVRQLLRAEQMSDKFKEAFKKTVDSSYTSEMARKCFEESLVNTEIAIELPESGYIVSMCAQSAYDFIYDSIESINTMDAKYQQATVLTTAINSVCVPDPEDPGSYFEILETEDKIKLIFGLQTKDISILGSKISELLEGMNFKFGLFDVNCPNRKCRNHIDVIPVEMDSILFHKYQQAMETSTDIE